jgi:hypothetical protein
MSALPQALPLALSAAVYPPALLVLLLLLNGQHPRQLVLAYYGGAAILTISAGLIVLAVPQRGEPNDPELENRQRRALHPYRAAAARASSVGLATKGPRTGGDASRRQRGPRPHRRMGTARHHEPDVGVRPRPGHVPAIAPVPPGGQEHRRQR